VSPNLLIYMGCDGIEIRPKSMIPRRFETWNRIVTPAVTPIYTEIPMVADTRQWTSWPIAMESNSTASRNWRAILPNMR
jgi:hypothetical protein